MTQWVAVSRKEHANERWWPRQGYAFAAHQQVAPIVIAELSKLLPHYALGFIRQDDGYQPVALIGLGGERNLYVNVDGRWLANYVPAELRGYPFTLAKAKNNQHVLCIEQQSLTDDAVAQPLFDDLGELSGRTQQILDFLNQCEKSRLATDAACQRLADADLIEAWPLKLKRGEEEPIEVEGLYRINETILNQLAAETFTSLRQYGALSLAYAQLFSMNQLSQLAERSKFHASQQAKLDSRDADSLFDADDEFTFDFGD